MIDRLAPAALLLDRQCFEILCRNDSPQRIARRSAWATWLPQPGPNHAFGSAPSPGLRGDTVAPEEADFIRSPRRHVRSVPAVFKHKGFAVYRLIINSAFVVCSTGRSTAE